MAIDESLSIPCTSLFFCPINAALSCTLDNILTASLQPVEISVRRAVVSNPEVGDVLPISKTNETDVDFLIPSLWPLFRFIVL